MTDWADRVAINDVLARYADGVNRRDADLWSSTWDEEGEWFLFGPDPVKGRDAIVAAWKDAMVGYPFVVMFASQGAVEIDGGHASGVSYTNEVARTAAGTELRVTGRYTDRYVKRDGRWGFAFRQFEPLHQQQI
ncbi:nuclear transport factor 2 family protein [Novosphingobium malaysiense]|uniref:SnoaL-like domain-containing protein n=1 Tax=Novosphingobium malaysiense TaxID=1348853 RepID=A0A0B1ZNF7_9SPHN|nr:nuclear transport factor 2 family protein [Novosphingobium malaysiense]KHK92660.1 hypothetical protein LK12_07865 [Novosphingobium malaysiense]